jgi:hypothetical protein
LDEHRPAGVPWPAEPVLHPTPRRWLVENPSRLARRAALAALAALSLAILGLGGCMGRAGIPYLFFSWNVTPDYLVCTAPGLPGTIYSGAQYATSPGTWYCEYQQSAYNSGYWMHFTITVHSGRFLQDGEDSLFELYLDEDGYAGFYRHYSEQGTAQGRARAGAEGAQVVDTPPDHAGFDRETLGTFDAVRGGYRLTGTYGRFVPRS